MSRAPAFRPRFLLACLVALLAPLARAAAPAAAASERPNIVWIMGDDLGVELGCYGERLVRTPNVDRLASEGARFTRAYTTAPVCSPSRSALITGMYQTSIGAHHHRSHRTDGCTLPEGVKPITEHLRARGYYTVNGVPVAPGTRASGKTDFNFQLPPGSRPVYDGNDWSGRAPGQPFFAQLSFTEPHRGPAWPRARQSARRVDPAAVNLPPYYPDDPLARDDWANYLEAVNLLDEKVGAVLRRLEAEGLEKNTVVFFFSDNGRCHVRDKQFLYEGGLHIPLLARWPGRIRPGTVRDDLVSAIDISATTLRLAGAPLPPKLQGRPFLGPEGGPGAAPREYVFGARDRCDETVDRIRSVRGARYKLIRNYMPERPYTQPNAYKQRQYPVLGLMQRLHADGKLTPEQARFMAERRPAEELYDLQADPHELQNLAAAPAHAAVLKELRAALDGWIANTGDRGAEPEPESARREPARTGAAAPVAPTTGARKPNIVFVLVDDLRWDALGCTGHPFARTPHLDRLAREGAMFRNAFVAIPLCSPSRASFLTGQYPHRHGVIDNRDHGALSHNLVTFPRLLHDTGYETAYVGKWHMGTDDSPRPGFDRWVSFRGQGVYQNPVLNVDGQTGRVEGYITDLLNGHAVEFVRRRREKPFALYLAHKAVHGPFTPAARHAELYAADPITRRPNAQDTLEGKPALNRPGLNLPAVGPGTGSGDLLIRNQLRSLASIDDGVGDLLKALEETGQLEDTVFVFTSDNGYFWGEHGLGDKRAAYEESIRIPLLVRCPRRVRAGTVVEGSVLSIDVAPTFLELGGAPVPAEVQGRSFVPLLEGRPAPPREWLFLEYFHEPGYPRIPTWQAVRGERWKYIRYPELEGMDELYDLRDDPLELKNRIADPEAADGLRAARAALAELAPRKP